jgi:hydrogenase-4 component F
MSSLLIAIIVLPFIVAVATYFLPVRVSRILTVVSGAITFGLSLVLVPTAAAHAQVTAGGVLRADALSVVFLVATTFLYAATAVFACGYLDLSKGPAGDRYGRRFYAGINLFCWSMAAAPLVNGLALLWVAVEITTVISALLGAIDNTDGVVRLAYVLAVLGFGTKMGLVPVHTWLPDAHSEAPTPVSALLSGSLLAISFYAILRYFQIAVRTLGPAFPRNVLLIFGLASLLLAAVYLFSQRDLKRLLAYSSVEHMGILAIGMSFGAPIAIVGVLLHVLAHAAAKGTAFFGAGSVIRKFATKDMAKIRGGIGALPWSGPMFVTAILALSAMPPFGIFRSEFLIVAGGLSDPRDAVAAVLVVLVTLSFFGLSWSTTQTMLTPDAAVTGDGPASRGVLVKGEVSPWIVASMALGLVALVILGVHLPSQLSDLLTRAAGELASPR